MKIISILIFLVFFPTSAYAYLDPGMGSYILAMIAAFIAALMTYFKIVIEKIKNFFNKLGKLLKKKKK